MFNSCSHSGPDVVIAEAQAAWPGQPVRALVGGFHLFATADDDVRALARRMAGMGVEVVCTGHCTDPAAFGILQEELGADIVKPTRAGLVIEL